MPYFDVSTHTSFVLIYMHYKRKDGKININACLFVHTELFFPGSTPQLWPFSSPITDPSRSANSHFLLAKL